MNESTPPKRTAWNKGKSGLPANRPKNGSDKICLYCGKAFYKPASAQDRKYCSENCYYMARWGGSRMLNKVCTICGSQFHVTLCQDADKVTCSAACSRSAKRHRLEGEKSPLWRGGRTRPYCKEWHYYRQFALERDNYQCALCHSTDRIQVHHITPYRYSQNHDLDNLITLCRRCHSKEEIKVSKETAAGLKCRWTNQKAIAVVRMQAA